MKYSQLPFKTSKTVSGDLQAKNARLLTQAGFIHQEIAGVYTFLPLGLRVLKKIEQIIREEMDKIGVEITMTSLAPVQNWEQTKRLDTVDVLMKTSPANAAAKEKHDANYVLSPTHEEIVTPLVQEFVKSYKDLPVAVYQIQTKFRNEPRAKSGLLRCREFRMKDLYSFHISEADLMAYYEQSKTHYMTVFERLGLGKDTFITVAGGGDFTTNYSHEFQVLSDAGEDTIYLDRANRMAYNKEVATPADAEKLNVDFEKLEQVKACEVGNIFPLNTKFSDAFGFHYVAEDGTQQPIYMGCYGIGPSRLMGVIVEKFADDKGMVWPKNIAPFALHLISLPGAEQQAEQLYQDLTAQGIEVLWDDRTASAGVKFADADLIGIPLRAVVSSRLAGKIEVKKRTEVEARVIEAAELESMLRE